jgi:hypothetical protein
MSSTFSLVLIDKERKITEGIDEPKAKQAKIENHLGDFICKLCKGIYDNALGLAKHR